ncbi:MAG: mechanosensitive ion channel [Bacteroidales bacterium]|nr:mechanosensitive ion channel [Bacteroidales bacterium]
MGNYLRELTLWFTNLLVGHGFTQTNAAYSSELLIFIIWVLFSYVAYYVTWKLIRKLIIPILKRSKNQFDDLLVKHRFFRRLSYLVPAILIYYFNTDIVIHIKGLSSFISLVANGFFVFIVILMLDSLLSTINDFYDRFDFSKDHPIKGMIQIIKIILYILGGLFIIGTFLQRDLSSLLISLGTVSAVLMLIFKDPILGLVGGLQLIFNKMIRIGDWITIPKYNADGTVLEINLTTVKIQNWDKTISTVPTYSLISDSFQNWRGMEESGGRRLKRSINLDMDSVHFVTEEELEKFRKIKVLKPYLAKKEKEIGEHNRKNEIDPSILVNGRRMTNIGIFRAYLVAYLNNRDDIHSSMTFLVRQLQPSEKGIPIEVYVFTKTTAWADYENIQADIFDHILAVIPEFNLRVYQFPKSSDFSQIIKRN